MTRWSVIAVLLMGQAEGVRSWDFDRLAEEMLPEGWRVESTGQEAATAKWQVVRDETAPLGPGALELTATNHGERGVFNLCWTDAGTLDLADGWHLLKISHRGDRIRVYLDGDLKLMVNGADHLPQEGGVGLWTKADAATAFDSFTVVPR